MAANETALVITVISMFMASIGLAIRTITDINLKRAEIDRAKAELALRVFESWEIDKLLPDKLRLYSTESPHAVPERWVLTDDGEIMGVRDAKD